MDTLNKDLAAIQFNQVVKQLEEYDTEAMVNIYNQYADAMRYERIRDNDEHIINDLYSNPYDALLATSYGDYNISDDYFYFHNGNLISFNHLTSENSPIDIEELAQWLISEDKLAEYDITVTTLDDMYNCILDSLEGADSLDYVISISEHLNLSVEDFDSNNESPADYENNIINDILNEINNYSYEQLNKLITDLNINYE